MCIPAHRPFLHWHTFIWRLEHGYPCVPLESRLLMISFEFSYALKDIPNRTVRLRIQIVT
jgi:hypothetical protein